MVDVTPLLKVLKVVFLLCLISVCFFGFNFKSIKRFLDEEVIINESVEKHNALRPPVITICPNKWKTESATPQAETNNYERHCGNATTTEDYEACVINKTYGFEEMIQSATRGAFDRVVEDVTDPQLWTWDVTLAAMGRCYTLNYNQLFKLNPLRDGIVLNLVNIQEMNDYYIYLSEPDFYFITANPLTMPVTMVTLNGMESGHLSIMLKMVRTEELNRLEAPCNPDPDFSFTTCVRKSLAKRVNCTLPWARKMPGKQSQN